MTEIDELKVENEQLRQQLSKVGQYKQAIEYTLSGLKSEVHKLKVFVQNAADEENWDLDLGLKWVGKRNLQTWAQEILGIRQRN